MRIFVILCCFLSLLCNCILGIYIHRLYGTINNLKTSLNITNDRITELESKQTNKPSIKVYSPIQTHRFPNYEMKKTYIPDNNYFELQQQKDRLDSLQQQTDEINKKLRDEEIQKDAERLARPMFMF